jgi:rod shape-determining protein MreC
MVVTRRSRLGPGGDRARGHRSGWLRRSGSPGRDRPRRYVLAALVLTSLTTLTLDVRGFAPLESVRSGALAVFAPVASAAAGVFRPAGDAWNGAFEGADLKRENDELRRRVEDLQGRVAQDSAAAGELARLKDALDLPYAGSLQRVTAGVTAGAVADFDATIEIDKGSGAGITRGMPVVVDAGLVGSVAQVSGGRAVVRLVSDRGTRVGVAVAGTAIRGVVEGAGGPGAGGLVRATGVDIGADLRVGTLLVTAGTPGSLYPAGIPVGTVERVESDDAAQQKVADVRLAAHLDDLSFVTVLLHRPS